MRSVVDAAPRPALLVAQVRQGVGSPRLGRGAPARSMGDPRFLRGYLGRSRLPRVAS